MKQVWFSISELCDACGGHGIVTHPLWKEFYRADEKANYKLTQEQCDKWFAERGFYSLPPEESDCSRCRGSGKIDSEITLKELRKLLIEVNP
jgi:uncharacterized paraquat-inducible protein A